MGGSFDSTGGHNLIEPASYSRAIITGPSDFNIRNDISLFENGRGILQVSTMQQCWKEIDRLISDPQATHELGLQAARAINQTPDIAKLYFSKRLNAFSETRFFRLITIH